NGHPEKTGRGNLMRVSHVRRSIATALLVAVAAGLTMCGRGGGVAPADAPAADEGARHSTQDWPYGPYRIVENWPRPLPDTRHSHDGWTWGSMGSVYAETPDRIWIAQRGELPLPEGAMPWTPYASLNPSR